MSYESADAARDARDWPEAARLYAAYLETAPRDANIWVQLGHAEKEQGRAAPARLAYERALEVEPAQADIHLQLGHLLKDLGDYAPALSYYQTARRLGCGADDLDLHISHVSARLAEAPLPTPGSAGPLGGVGLSGADSARDERNWPEAARLYGRYLERNPEHSDIWVQLGHAEKERGEIASARRAYERARELAPSDADIHVQLGHLLKVLGEHEAALICYENALRLDPANRDAFREIRSYGGGAALAASGARERRVAAASLRPATQQGSLAFFTIASNNYLARVRVLLDGLREHYPEARLFLCVADRDTLPEHATLERCEVILASELGIADFDSFAFRYDQMEFCTALKPFMLRLLLDRLAFSSVIYLDPDIAVFGRSEDVLQRLWREACFVLTPHLRRPALGHVAPTDLSIMRAGAYNLGFLGASARPETFRWLDWWEDHLMFDCKNRPEDGLFVDQKYFDLLPGFTAAAQITRDPGLNLAYWNMTEHLLTREGAEWRVDDGPLQFFHFSGFHPEKPITLSRHTGMFNPITAPDLKTLAADYADALFRAGHRTYDGLDYAFGRFRDGSPIPRLVTRFFADSYGTWAGDPFADFLAEVLEPVVTGRHDGRAILMPRFARYLLQERPLLQTVFDIATPKGAAAFSEWLALEGPRSLGLGGSLLASLLDGFTDASPPSGRVKLNPEHVV